MKSNRAAILAFVICPNCNCEYREGFTRCSDCDVDLVEPSDVADTRPEIEIVKVFETGNPALISIVESLLEDADIEYSKSRENLQDLFGWGRLGGTYNYITGPVMFYVRADDEAEARGLIAPLLEETQ